jgi:NAD(P)-dependent dehydrogenase (short-subunit alcohol dehydrogenase family)
MKRASARFFFARFSEEKTRKAACTDLLPAKRTRSVMQIKDKVFVITGGASGLGAACARMIAAQGGKLVIADLHDDAGAALAAELHGSFVHCDVTSEADGKNVMQIAAGLGQVCGLIHCAGIAPAAKVLGKDGVHALDLFQRTIEVNLSGSFNMARLTAEAMANNPANDDGERGVIILTASIAAFEGQMGQAAYAASKAGVVGLTLPMARDLAGKGIRVMTIAPGIFETPMVLGMPAEVRQALGDMTPFPQRLGRPAEFAHLAKTIIENAMLNGETIRLDGAVRMQAR